MRTPPNLFSLWALESGVVVRGAQAVGRAGKAARPEGARMQGGDRCLHLVGAGLAMAQVPESHPLQGLIHAPAPGIARPWMTSSTPPTKSAMNNERQNTISHALVIDSWRTRYSRPDSISPQA